MNSPGRIRSATVADADGLAHLAARSFPLACPPDLSRDAIEQHISTRLSVDAFADVLEDREVRLRVRQGASSQTREQVPPPGDGTDSPGPLDGYVLLRRSPPHPGLPPGRWLLLERIYVDPGVLGDAVGHELMLDAQRLAAEDGFDGLWLGTNKHNDRALRFYRRHGFGIVGERVFHVGDTPNCDWVLLWRASGG